MGYGGWGAGFTVTPQHTPQRTPQRTPQHTPPRVPIPRLDLTPQSLKLANGKPVVLPQNVDDDSGSSSWSSSGSSSLP
jgi:hypothetical protein